MGANWCFHDWCCIKKLEKLVEGLVCFYHITYRILCKSNKVEKFDKSNLSVLSKLEKDVKLWDTLESINPSLKPFFHLKKTVVEAVLKLVTYDKSANSCSLTGEFDCRWTRRKDQTYVLVSPKEICKAWVFSCFDNSSAWSAADIAPWNWER